MKILAIVLILFTMTSLGFSQAKQNKIKIYKNPEAMKQELTKLIPIGSRIAEAQLTMEANKFSCWAAKGDSFTTGTEDKTSGEYKNINFLSCRRTKSALAGFVDPRRLFHMRLWKIAIVEEDGVVSDILVYVGWDCEL